MATSWLTLAVAGQVLVGSAPARPARRQRAGHLDRAARMPPPRVEDVREPLARSVHEPIVIRWLLLTGLFNYLAIVFIIRFSWASSDPCTPPLLRNVRCAFLFALLSYR